MMSVKLSTEKSPELYQVPAVIPPSIQDLQKLSNDLGFKISAEDLPQYREAICGFLKSFDELENLPEPTLPVTYPRLPGYRPHPRDNPLNAWEWRCDIKGAEKGKLSGLKVGIKNTIAVAGVPLTNGSKLLAGYIPEYDASVVRRILDEGGNIVGMTTCEDLCFSASSFTNTHGPVLNPHDNTRTTGGSSCGSAATLVSGDTDLTLGGDQGGSIRIPASWCGVVGLKPTHGLVPYTGICSLEPSIDHVGPMARTVRECALLLEVIAGYDDGLDPRQPCNLTVPEYSKLLTGKVEGMKIALIQEGFENCEEDVQMMVYQAAEKLGLSGATVESITFPEHEKTNAVWASICVSGFYNTVMHNQGAGTGFKGFYPTSLMDTLATRIAAEPHHFSEVSKMTLLTARHIEERHHNRFYGKAQNFVREIKKKFDELLTNYDVLIMPTLPFKAPKLPLADSTIAERIKSSISMIQNTAVYNATGHPALSVPAGVSDGLPVGMMIVGGSFQETKVLNVAYAWELLRDQ